MNEDSPVSIPIKDVKRIRQLVGEGKNISKVMEEDFPKYGYWEIYNAAAEGDERSAMGVKRMIANRLKKLDGAAQAERDQFIEQLDDLVWNLYQRLKSNQKKLASIREIVDAK